MRGRLDAARPSRTLGGATADFFYRLPALLAALCLLRLAELLAGNQAGGTVAEVTRMVLAALLVDLVNLARFLPGLYLLALPFLLLRSRKAGAWLLAMAWTGVLLLQAALVQYFLVARVPLGADWFGYSLVELRNTVRGGIEFSPWIVTGLALALATLWLMLSARSRVDEESSRANAVLLLGGLLVLAVAPARSEFIRTADEDMRTLQVSKLGFFLDDNVGYFLPATRQLQPMAFLPTTEPTTASSTPDEFERLDPAYPFLHAEHTPDALGRFFHVRAGKPPNLVLVIVEGLGRSFSGPDAALGSFTPELDKLVDRSLYWENFLAVQGRTFGVMPSLLASAPFGEGGLSALGQKLPPHHSLLSVLKDNGYRLRFYCGYDADFDNEALYLGSQGMESLVDRFNFGGDYQPGNSWGFGDADLVSRALEGEKNAPPGGPFLMMMKTVTMHSPYVFRGQAGFAARFEQRLDELGISQSRKARYRAHQDIYTSILYADQALGRFFEHSRKLPGYENTVFVVVGDHRLPEIPMATRIERYHVPLMIFSPLLKTPARIKAVSSHFDITPSLLAFLSANVGLKRPPAVTWLGRGLDTATEFRSLHRFPMKQTKTNLVDYVSGPWFINHDQLYRLHDGLRIEPGFNASTRTAVQSRFAAFRADNDAFIRSGALMPAQAQAGQRPPTSVPVVQAVRQVSLPAGSDRAALTLEVVFENRGEVTTDSFEPIVVLSSRTGAPISETYGALQRLLPGQRQSVQFSVGTGRLRPGPYFVAVISVRPRSNQRVGTGRHRVPVHVDP